MEPIPILPRVARCLLRVSLAASFLSAVADRFGLWGPPGTEGISWGDWSSFVDYVALLNGFAPTALVLPLAWAATAAEVALALGLLIGWRLRYMALASGLLLTSFALSMAFSLGIKAPLDDSVFTAAAAALVLFTITPQR